MEDLVKQYKAQIEALQTELQKKQKRLQEAETLILEIQLDLIKFKNNENRLQ